ncbi:MAG: efflux RND transporter periplasmic adaptor subunit [Acidobacteria bacterium]|nr:efflux RND transporter periplasmic adaptor subunit [Acidobacteriota bacterium]
MKRKIVTISIVVLLVAAGAAAWMYRGVIRAKAQSAWAVLREAKMALGGREQGHEGQGGVPVAGQGERKVLYWVDPMHPAYKWDKPGKAPDCGMDLVPVYAEEGRAAENLPPDAVQISPRKLQLIGVEYGEVAFQPLSKTIRTVGRLAYDETKIARIHTKIEGWIERVYVDFTGKLVEKNQPLISIYSPELVSTQQEFLLAKKAKDYLKSSPVQQIAANALSLYEASRERLRLWDISEEQIKELEERGASTKTLTLYSPLDGFVLARNAFEKQRVTPETELYAIADLSTVWVLADVYEYELPMIRLGQEATMTLSYSPGKAFTGKVTYIYPQLDNMTRTLKVRLEFPNPDFQLKPDMYANVELRIDYGRQVSVPEEAVLDSGAEQIVFVAYEGGYFEPRKVQLGGKVDDRYIIGKGLKPGERIVTSGNFLIDSESRLKSAMGGMAGMGHGGGTPAGGEQKAAAPEQRQREADRQPDHLQHEQTRPKEPASPAEPPHRH